MNEEEKSHKSEDIEIEVLPPSAVEALQRGEIDTQISTAHKYPRSIATFKKRAIEMVSLDEDTAASCIYSRPVGKENGVMKYAEGMSVRLAEIVGACYGNLRVGATIVEMTQRHVTARGYAHDLESNYASSSEVIESTVDKHGRSYTERMRVVVAKAALAKARRDATFVVVPKALCRPLEDRARQIAIGDATTLAKRRAAVMGWVFKLGVPIERVFAALGIKGEDDIGIDELTTLTGLKTSIKDGEVSVDEAFPVASSAAATERAAKPDWDKLEKDAGLQAEPPTNPLPPKRRQRSGPVPSTAVKEPAGVTSPTAAKDLLYTELPDDASRSDFLEALRRMGYPGVPASITKIEELPEEVCAKILSEGVDKIWAKVIFPSEIKREELFPEEGGTQSPLDQ